MDGQWYWDHAVVFARWQHHAVGAERGVMAPLVYGLLAGQWS